MVGLPEQPDLLSLQDLRSLIGGGKILETDLVRFEIVAHHTVTTGRRTAVVAAAVGIGDIGVVAGFIATHAAIPATHLNTIGMAQVPLVLVTVVTPLVAELTLH